MITFQTNDFNDNYDNTDIDQALERLQNSLLGNMRSQSIHSLIQTKEFLCDYLRFYKPRRFLLKSFKRYWFVLHNTQLTYYTDESQQRNTPIEKISLKGCEILPDVNISTKKYAIRLMVPSIDGMNEALIKCSTVSFHLRMKCDNVFGKFCSLRKNNMQHGWQHFVWHRKVELSTNHPTKPNANRSSLY